MTLQQTQQNETNPAGVEILERSRSGFENFMMQCLRCPEPQFRRFLHKVLIRAGFELFEDGYESDRCEKDPRYKTVHNLLAIRGHKPNICLVAHTDVCRDHEALRDSGRFVGYGFNWQQEKDKPADAKKRAPDVVVQPVIKSWRDEQGVVQRIIQDRDCKVQVGGDDRLGCAINLYIALNTGYDMGLLFTTDEESGLKSAKVCQFEQLMDFDLMCQVDRGNNSNEVVIKISNEILCSYETAASLLEIAFDIGLPRKCVTGMHTDVYAMKSQNRIRDCINMTCGYHNSRGADPTEYIDIQEAKDTLRYVAEIVKHYHFRGSEAVEPADDAVATDPNVATTIDEVVASPTIVPTGSCDAAAN